MLLNGDQISKLNLVENPVTTSLKDASYDLTVGEIIDVDGHVLEEFVIAPQCIAWVVSRERIILPEGYISFATIKTGLCNRGVLAINIGIIDPGWSGPISTALINFGRRSVILKPGDEFLRLTFHKFRKNNVIEFQKNFKTRENYIREKSDSALNDFGSMFLSIDDISESTYKKVSSRILSGFASQMTVMGFLIAIIVVILNFVNLESIQSFISPAATFASRDDMVREISNMKEEIVSEIISEMVRRNDLLEK